MVAITRIAGRGVTTQQGRHAVLATHPTNAVIMIAFVGRENWMHPLSKWCRVHASRSVLFVGRFGPTDPIISINM